ncbi:hypothetical protein LCGC14_2526890, partial [marine sediment metagenome]
MDSRTYPQGSGTIKSKYVAGVLTFYDTSGNIIYTINPATRTLTIPSGSTLSIAGTVAHTGTQTFDDIIGNDPSLGIDGAAPATVTAAGGAVVVT